MEVVGGKEQGIYALVFLFPPALPALFFEIGYGALDNFTVIDIYTCLCKWNIGTTARETLLHAAYFGDGSCDSGTDVEDE